MAKKLNTPEFRVAFPAVFKPRKNELSGKDEFSVTALFKTDQDLKALKDAAREACEDKWGKDPKKWPQNLRSPFRDQGDRAKIDEVTGKESLPQGYVKGATYITLRSEKPPGVVKKVKGVTETIIDTAEFYGGCYAIASVNAYAYDMKGNRGVSFGLGNVLKVKDGEPFGTRTKPEEDFKSAADSQLEAEGGEMPTASDLFS